MKLPRRSFLVALFVAPFARKMKLPVCKTAYIKPDVRIGIESSEFLRCVELQADQIDRLFIRANPAFYGFFAQSPDLLAKIERSTRETWNAARPETSVP